MTLVLAPSYDDHTREQVEAHLDVVRSNRMVAAIEYHAGRKAKLEHESDKIRLRIEKQYAMLGKEIDGLEKAEEKVLKRLETLEALKQEVGLITDMVEIHEPNEE
jgi:hypothetical protein